MGKRRRHLFVLLFVLGLVVVSALVIATKPTKLGLDLKGGIELIYQGTPTGQVKEVTGGDIDRSIEIIRERIDELGVSEPEVSRLGSDRDLGQPPRRHQRPAGDRPGRDDRPALLLRLGAEPDRPREGDRRPPRPPAPGGRRSKKPKKNGKKPGRNAEKPDRTSS